VAYCFIGTFKSAQIFISLLQGIARFELPEGESSVSKLKNFSVYIISQGFYSDHFIRPPFHISMWFDYRQLFAV